MVIAEWQIRASRPPSRRWDAEPRVERGAVGSGAPDVLLDRSVRLQVFAGRPNRCEHMCETERRRILTSRHHQVRTSPEPARSGWIRASIRHTAVAAEGVSGRKAIPRAKSQPFSGRSSSHAAPDVRHRVDASPHLTLIDGEELKLRKAHRHQVIGEFGDHVLLHEGRPRVG
jgi:hypothetical protein